MIRKTRSIPRRGAALGMALALVTSTFLGAPLASAQTDDTGAPAESTVKTLDNAEFRWGINDESRTKGLAPGTFNMFSAGDVGGTLPGGYSTLRQEDWLASEGDVRIEKRGSNGKATLATWKGTQTDRGGQEIARSGSADSGLEIVFRGGEGELDPENGKADIAWKGTATVLYYSGYAVFTISDPVLTIDGDRAQVTATMGGYESSRTDTDLWSEISPEKNVVIADLDSSEIALDNDKGINPTPKYFGVRYRGGEQAENDHFGSFPQSFVDFVTKAGIGPFWYSTGGAADSRKHPLDIAVSWDAQNAVDVQSGGTSKGILAQVVDDTVEDILRSAGTDVSDTAAAWMDEAWKPLQPDAVKAAQQPAPSDGGTAAGDVVEASVDEEFEEYFDEYYTSTTPITAGTVMNTVSSAPATSGGAAARSGPEPAAAPVSDQATMPVAANLPLSEAVYAQTSASSEAGNPTRQWQWWVGFALLALAAGLFYQTVRRKD